MRQQTACLVALIEPEKASRLKPDHRVQQCYVEIHNTEDA